MENKLQELTDKIYNEGVEKGKEEAARIIEEASLQKSQIIDKAKSEADRIVTEAQRKADELKQNTQAELRLFAGQAVEALKTEIVNLVTNRLAASAVQSATDSPDFMPQIMLTIAQEWAKTGNMVIRTSHAEQLKAYFEANAKSLLNSGVKIEQVNGLPAGFEIAPADGSYKIVFGQDEFINYFKAFLRPQLVNMLF